MQERCSNTQMKENNHQAVMEMIEERRLESLREAHEMRRAEKIKNALNLITPRYRDKTFADFKVDNDEQSRIKKVCVRFVETIDARKLDGSCLTLVGSIGTGKTLIALIMNQALVKSGHHAHYESSLRFLRKFQDKNFESDAALEKLLDDYKKIPFLIIDEVTEGFGGKGGQLADWEKQMLFTLIDMRYHEKLCTVVISNRTKNEMIERVGARTMDRLSENGITLAFNWNSYRHK